MSTVSGYAEPHVSTTQPDITDTGAKVKTANGAGYSPPSARDGDPRTGSFGHEHLCDPFDEGCDTDEDC